MKIGEFSINYVIARNRGAVTACACKGKQSAITMENQDYFRFGLDTSFGLLDQHP